MGMFDLRFELRQVCAVTGGASGSIFPEVDKLLLGDTEYQKALAFVAGRKDMDRYRSMVDFLLAEIWLQWKPKCFAYYEHGGEKRLLKNQITEPERVHYERWMIAALNHAKRKMEEKRAESWTSFRIEVLRLAA